MKVKIPGALYLSVFCFIMILLSACSNSSGGKLIYIENGKIRLGFDRKTGAFLVFQNMVNSQEFLAKNNIPGSLWEIDLFKPSGKRSFDINALSEFYCSKPDSMTLRLVWDHFREVKNKNFQITAIIRLDKKKPLSYWKISVRGIEGMKISRVVFPKIQGIKSLSKEYLAVPAWMGQIIKDPRIRLSQVHKSEKKFEWNYPGPLSMQCLALYNPDKAGLYFSCNDSLAYSKDFSFTLDTLNNLTYGLNNYPAFDSTLKDYAPRYEGIIGIFKGDWLTAAEQYREWGTKQKWCRESRFRNGLVPSWLEKTGYWVWNRGKSDNVLIPAVDLRRRLNLPVSVFWHWWHHNPYDAELPDYFPPREGKRSFVSALSSAQNKGINAIVYLNQDLWDTTVVSWKKDKADLYAVKDINGRTMTKVYNIFTNSPLANMCMATSFWKDEYTSLCDSAINNYHTNGVYMDMACTNYKCYASNHGHSIGGGNYWVKNFGELTEQIRTSVNHKNNPVLTGEGCGETWLPYLDAFLTLQVSRERYAGINGWEVRGKLKKYDDWETIPFFQAVYHPYGITYGNYSSLIIPPYDQLWPKKFAPAHPDALLSKDFNKQFLMEQARSFVWGMQPTIANYESFEATERKKEITYMINLAKVRYRGMKYLLYGKFLRSPEMQVPEKVLKISRLSIYAGRSGKSVTTFQKKFPLIYSGTWKSMDGRIGIALASISDDPYPVNMDFSAGQYGLPAAGDIYLIQAKGKRLLTSYKDGTIKINFTLNPESMCIAEIVPGS